MTRERLNGAIEALEELPRSFVVSEALVQYRAQLAALPEPAHPWTGRERRLREALEKAEKKLSQWTVPEWYGDRVVAHHELSQIKAALAEAPPSDPRDEVIPPAPPRASGTITATLSYAGKGKPLPCEPDPRDEALEVLREIVGNCRIGWYDAKRHELRVPDEIWERAKAIARAKGGR